MINCQQNIQNYYADEEDEIAVGIISGKEVLETRVIGQAETWFHQFPHVSVFSDYFDPIAIKRITQLAKHTNVSFITVENKSDHLIGTPWASRWYHAQPRFLSSMKKLYETNPNAKWFLFGDDDTYLVAKNIRRRLIKYDYDEPTVVSFFWCQWSSVAQYMKPHRDCRPFAQGGSGVLYTRKMMDMIYPHLDMCNDIFNDANHAASMRIANCIENFFGINNWTSGAFIKPWRSGFHYSNPDKVIIEGNTWDAPGSFHQVNRNLMKKIHNSHICTVSDGYYDFSYYMFMSAPVEITYCTNWELHFGYCIDMYGSHLFRINAITPIVCVDEKNMKFTQEFENNVVVYIDNNPDLEIGDIYIDDVVRSINKTEIYVYVNCPEKNFV